MWAILGKYSRTSELWQLAKDLVEQFERREVLVDYTKSGFIDDEEWKRIHGGVLEEKYDAAHVLTENGKHAVLYRKKVFEEKKRTWDALTFKIYYLETTMHEFLHIVGYKNDIEVDKRTKEILRKTMDIGVK